MNKVCLICPRCKEIFDTDKAESYECPKCGTSMTPNKNLDDEDATHILKN